MAVLLFVLLLLVMLVLGVLLVLMVLVSREGGRVVGTNERPNHGPWPAALHCPALHLSEHTPANTPNTPS